MGLYVYCGVRQGSFLTPVQFTLLFASPWAYSWFKGMFYICYADDIQLYILLRQQKLA